MRVILQIGKIIIAGILSSVFLSIVSIVYCYSMINVPTITRVSAYSGVPGSLRSTMREGFGWNLMDANGFNNDVAYDDVDVLIMGASHIEAIQVDRSENVTHKLDEMLPNYHVYNIGTSGQTIERCAYYLENACNYFSPCYVVIDLTSLELDKEIIDSVLTGTYQESEIYAEDLRVIYNYVPASRQLRERIGEWKNLSDFSEAGGDEVSLQDDITYKKMWKKFLSYIGNICSEHDTQLILIYHPSNYDVDATGQLVFEDETYEWAIFQKFCEENNIVLVSTKDEYIRMYNEDHVVPNGFANTRLGSGHINKYGHTAMANVLYETIKSLEEK